MRQFLITVTLTSEQDFWIEASDSDAASAAFDEEMDHYSLTDDEVTNESRQVVELRPGDYFYEDPPR